MLERILVPVDGSQRAEAVFGRMRELFHRPGTEVLVVRAAWVHPSLRGVDHSSLLAQLQGEAKLYVDGLVRRLADQGLQARGLAPAGFPAEILLDTAAAEGVGLIAMTSHGCSGYPRWVLGSVAEKVLQASRVPVLLTRSFHAGAPPPEESLRIRRILVPTDGSEVSLGVVPAAAELALVSRAQVVVLHVAEVGTEAAGADEIAASASRRFSKQGTQATAMSLRGDPASRIVDAERSEGIDLIAMATHGGARGFRWPMGSVTQKVVRGARGPILVVRVGQPPASVPRQAMGDVPAGERLHS